MAGYSCSSNTMILTCSVSVRQEGFCRYARVVTQVSPSPVGPWILTHDLLPRSPFFVRIRVVRTQASRLAGIVEEQSRL